MHRRYSKPNIVYRILEKASSFVDYLILHKRYLLGIVIFTALFFFVAIRFKRMFFTFFLISLGSVSMVYQRYFEFSKYIGLELCMMSTVLVALAYGPAFGAFTGFATIFFALIISGNFKHSSFISFIALPLVGFSVQFFKELPLLYLGILMTAIYDALVLPLYVLLGSRAASSAVFFITHLLINIWVFTTIAPFIYQFMA